MEKYNFKIEKLLTADEIDQCKNFMAQHSASENKILIRVLCDMFINSTCYRLWIPERYQNVYCSLYSALKEFFSDYLASTPSIRESTA